MRKFISVALVLGISFVMYSLLSCKKDEPSNPLTPNSATQLLLEGKWKYAKSVRVDSEYFALSAYNQPWPFAAPWGIVFDLDTTYNYLKFSSDGTLYSFQSSWGTGQAGRFYEDTVRYNISGSFIYLSYPAGVNSEAHSVTATPAEPIIYNAYQDTITIISLTANTITIKRNYHYKHYGWTQTTSVKKESVDSLVKH